jgi:alpha-galactosidase
MQIGLLLLLASSAVLGLDNGLARTPQMGWNSWNHFACGINETLIRDTADLLVATGLSQIGYKYLNLDDCWEAPSRDPNGNLQFNPTSFPSGGTALGTYIHSKGLKFGIYSSAGEKTCQGRPASLNHETADANQFANWGVDYLKLDNCYNDNVDPKVRYPKMRDALNATGRPILFSLCEWGDEDPATWAGPVGNSWRTTGDISDSYAAMISIAEYNNQWAKYAGPGQWNDPDMLQVGNGGMTTDEDRTHFSLWCLMKAPLLIGCDISKMTPDTYAILTNAEAVAVNQDALGVQGQRVYPTNSSAQEVWAGPQSNGDIAVVLMNKGLAATSITVTWAMLGLNPTAQQSVRDLWAHSTVGTFTGSYSATVASHAVAFLRLSAV